MKPAFSGILIRYIPKTTDQSDQKLPTPDDSAASKISNDELHLNLWEFDSCKQFDVGIKIEKPNLISDVLINFPWKIDSSEILDLGGKLNSEKTVAAIFNEIVEYKGAADLHYATIEFKPHNFIGDTQPNKPKKFHIIRLNGKSFEIAYEPISGKNITTQVKIKITQITQFINEIDGDDPIYIRFRVKNIPKDVYSAKFKQQDWSFLSSATETTIIDFRINVRRGIPDEILSSYETSKSVFPKFKKIHFFLTLDRSEFCEFESKFFVGCRSLFDEDVWNDYVRVGHEKVIDVKSYLGYQWTATPSNSNGNNFVKDLTVLGRFSSTTSGTLFIIRFIFYIVVFGAIGSGTWESLQSFPNDFVKNNRLVFLFVISLVIFISSLKFEDCKKWTHHLLVKAKHHIRRVFSS